MRTNGTTRFGTTSASRGGALLLALTAACGGSGGTTLAVPAVDTLPGGAVRVVNAAPSAWTDTSGWKLTLERSVGRSGDSALLRDPRTLVATADGHIAVLDRKPARLLLFGADGALRRTIGREGPGPGEYGDFGELLLVGDTLVVNDRAQSRLVFFTLDGAHLRTVPSGRMSAQWPTSRDGRFLTEAYLQKGPQTPDDWFPGRGAIRRRSDGAPLDSVRFPKVPEPRVWRLKNATTDLGYYVPFMPDHERTFDRSGRLVYGDQAVYRLFVSAHGHDTVRIIEAPSASVTIPDSLRRAEFDAAIRFGDWLKPIASLGDIPASYPAWSVLAVDGADRLWVLRPGPRGPGDGWDVFTPTGTLLGRVPAPFPDADGTFWTADRVYRIGETADGEPLIEIWRIVTGD